MHIARHGHFCRNQIVFWCFCCLYCCVFRCSICNDGVILPACAVWCFQNPLCNACCCHQQFGVLVFLHLQTRRLPYLLMFPCFAVTVLVFSVSLLRNAHCPPWALLSRQPDSVLVFCCLYCCVFWCPICNDGVIFTCLCCFVFAASVLVLWCPFA